MLLEGNVAEIKNYEKSYHKVPSLSFYFSSQVGYALAFQWHISYS